MSSKRKVERKRIRVCKDMLWMNGSMYGWSRWRAKLWRHLWKYSVRCALRPLSPPTPPHTCPRHAANTDHNSEIAFSLKLVFSQIRLAIYTTCLTAVKTNTWTSVPFRFLQDWSVRLFTSGNRQLCTGLCPYVTGLKFTFSLVRSTSFPQ